MAAECNRLLTKFNIQLRVHCNRCNKIVATSTHDQTELKKVKTSATGSREAIISVQKYWVDDQNEPEHDGLQQEEQPAESGEPTDEQLKQLIIEKRSRFDRGKLLMHPNSSTEQNSNSVTN